MLSLDVDDIIRRLLDARMAKPGKLVFLEEKEIRGLCT
jgi:hypothetical protein